MSESRVELGDLSDLADGQMRCFEHVGRYGVVVCRAGGSLYALEDNCSHADTPLSEGRFRGTTITCPLHGAQFDVRDGTHAGPPAWEGVATFEISENGGAATIDVAPSEVDSANDGFGDVGGMFRTR